MSKMSREKLYLASILPESLQNTKIVQFRDSIKELRVHKPFEGYEGSWEDFLTMFQGLASLYDSFESCGVGVGFPVSQGIANQKRVIELFRADWLEFFKAVDLEMLGVNNLSLVPTKRVKCLDNLLLTPIEPKFELNVGLRDKNNIPHYTVSREGNLDSCIKKYNDYVNSTPKKVIDSLINENPKIADEIRKNVQEKPRKRRWYHPITSIPTDLYYSVETKDPKFTLLGYVSTKGICLDKQNNKIEEAQ